jgi:hypothetical protein
MFHKIKKIIVSTALSLVLLASARAAFIPVGAHADAAVDAACNAVSAATGGAANGNCTKDDTGFKKIIGTVISILTIIVGAVSVIMIIIGGFRYVVSNGDSGAVSGAKNTILYAVVGLVIALSAQLIVAFVINKS